MQIALFDYGTGNLHSLQKALERGGDNVYVETDIARALRADVLVLPGVGSFHGASSRIAPHAAALREALGNGLPCLAVCLGMQLLFEASDEGPGAGIALLAGRVRRVHAPRVPHMGWNDVEPRGDPLFEGLARPIVYFANSYVAEPAHPARAIAWTEYGQDRFPAAVRAARTWGVQFHPEKSGATGLQLIRNFLRQAAA
jgi:glutamine amidotransferase